MERVHEQLLELIRCSMWGTTPSASLFEGDVNWNALLKIAQQQAVLGPIYTQLELLSAMPSKQTMMHLYKLTTLNRRIQLKQLQILDTITKRLQTAGIMRPVLLKGIGISQNYLDPGVRQCGDIDLYVGKEHFEKACALARSWSESKIEYNALSHKDFHITFDGITVEIHRLAITDTNITKHKSEFEDWCSSQLEGNDVRCEEIEGVTVYLPPYNFDAIYVFQHAWDHFCTSGIAFRQICDWARLLTAQRDKIDRKQVAERLHYFGIELPWCFFSALAINRLGLNQADAIAFDGSRDWHTDKIATRIWDGGNFGFYSGKYAGAETCLLQREFTNFMAIFHSFGFLSSINRGYAYSYLYRAIIYIIKTKLRRIYYTITRQ